jgi:hypothetical protein
MLNSNMLIVAMLSAVTLGAFMPIVSLMNVIKLNTVMLNVMLGVLYAECRPPKYHYVEYCYPADCRYAECHGAIQYDG